MTKFILFVFLLFVSFATYPAKTWLANQEIIPCAEHEWTCRDGTCIDFDGKCNGTAECRDGSDEIYPSCRNNRCPDNMFRCAYGACVDAFVVCDGQPHCNDLSDEEISQCYNTSNVVLGKFKCDDGQEIPLSSMCDGLRDCLDSSDEDIKTCATQGCPAFMYQCAYGACIDQGANCDGVNDCADGSDETDELCKWRPLSEIKLELPPGHCILPTYQEHGGYTVDGAPNAIPGQGYDSVTVNLFCNEGFAFLGNGTVKCSKGKWSRAMPKCERACKLEKHESVEYKCLNSLKDKQSIRTCAEYEANGILVSPQCKPTYFYPDALPKYMQCINSEWDQIITCTTGFCKFPQHVSVKNYDCVTIEGIEVTAYACEEPVPEETLIVPVCKNQHYVTDEVIDVAQCYDGTWTKTPQCKPVCGQWSETEGGIIPWHAGIYSKSSTPYEHVCGGSLITNTIVVSAAHCFWTEKLKPTTNFVVAVGKLYRDWNHPSDYFVQRSSIADIKIPNNFDGISNNFEADLALVFVSSPFEYNSYVSPVCFDFDTRFNVDQLHGTFNGKVAGWGPTTEKGVSTNELKSLDFRYVRTRECLSNTSAELQKYITYDKICAKSENGTALCTYDAGGGLVYLDVESTTETYYLRGVISLPTLNKTQCGVEDYRIFTHLNEFKTFFKQYVN